MRVIHRFIQHESFAGLLLMLAAAVALLIDNSPLSMHYQLLLNQQLGHESYRHWINHGLMTVFFITVGLEIKRELLQGELHGIKKALLPGIAAVGGILVPIAIFFALNIAHPSHWRGWAIPMATDIAFSLGIMTLLGKRCPFALKCFLMALATFDDLGAIAVIALFYSGALNLSMLAWAALCLLSLYALNARRISNPLPYLSIGMALWYCTQQAGIDPAISGIAIAFSIPLQSKYHSPAAALEKRLHPWVAYGVLPLFALANSGVRLADLDLATLYHPLTLGIILGLVVGKPIGVVLFSWSAVKLRLAALPSSVNWCQLSGVALLCGVGFTMSLFIGELAFAETASDFSNHYRLGILVASITAGCLGFACLKRASR